MFGKKYDTSGLSAEDKTWVEKIGGFGGWARAAKDAVAENRADRVRYLLGYHKLSRDDRVDLAGTAVQASAGAALAAVLKKGGFDFDDSSSGDRAFAKKFFYAALEKRDLDVWKTLSHFNGKAGASGLDKEMPILMAAQAGWRAAVGQHLESADGRDEETFSIAINVLSLQAADDLAFALSWTAKFNNHGPTLNAALLDVTARGEIDKTLLLLEKGADPNEAAGQPMYNALAFGHKEVFELLVERGGDLKTHGRDIVTRLRQQNPGSPLIDMASGVVNDVLALHERDEMQNRSRQRYHLVADDSFSETLHLPEGRRLTTVFNFSTRQQTVIAETLAAEGQAASMAVSTRDFADIKDDMLVEQAAAQLVTLGGTLPEDHLRVLPKAGVLHRPAGR